MKQREYIFKKLKESKPFLEANYNINRLGVFGSYSRDEYTEESDVDILVEYSKPLSLFKVVEMVDYLQNILSKKVDLVSKKDIKDSLKLRILNEVIML
ncbi:MAG: nucleotidyltransferase family protein [Planctomycetaceae bacterium]|jgi:predicted nucleotidyltransferase|nr:nucleotidyltransferase family protein [Planctomycetaceae bacterium]